MPPLSPLRGCRAAERLRASHTPQRSGTRQHRDETVRVLCSMLLRKTAPGGSAAPAVTDRTGRGGFARSPTAAQAPVRAERASSSPQEGRTLPGPLRTEWALKYHAFPMLARGHCGLLCREGGGDPASPGPGSPQPGPVMCSLDALNSMGPGGCRVGGCCLPWGDEG